MLYVEVALDGTERGGWPLYNWTLRDDKGGRKLACGASQWRSEDAASDDAKRFLGALNGGQRLFAIICPSDKDSEA